MTSDAQRHADLKKFLLEEPAPTDPQGFIRRLLDPSGSVAGLSVGLTLEEVIALGFEPESFGDLEHEGVIEREGFDDDPRHRLEYSLEDETLCSVLYELTAPDSDLVAVEQSFSDALEALLGEPIVFEGAKHWMFGDDAQFILDLHLEAVDDDDGDEFGFAPQARLGTVSLLLWSGEDGEFPASFDSSELETVLRSFVNETFGDKIELGDANIWMEAPYVYFNLIVETPDDELDFDWEGVPLAGGALNESFKEAVIEEFNMVLDL